MLTSDVSVSNLQTQKNEHKSATYIDYTVKSLTKFDNKIATF